MGETTTIKQFGLREIAVDGVDEASRKLRFSFMTEAPCDNWFVPEVCLCAKGNVDLTRFENGVMPMLFNHNRDIVIGKIENVSFEDGKVTAEATIDKDEESEKYFQKILSGSLKGISVGYRRLNTVRVLKGTSYKGLAFDCDMDVTDRWEPYEISLVSCPADPDCAVGRGLTNTDMTISIVQNEEEPKMGENQKPEAPAINEAAVREAAEKAARAERARVTEVTKVCRGMGVDDETMRGYIENGTSIEDVRKEILEKAMSAPKNQPSGINVVTDEKEKFAKRAVDGMAIRFGVIGEEKAVSNEYANASLRSIAEDALTLFGGMSERKAHLMNSNDLFNAMFKERAMGTDQFVSIVDNFGNKVMLKSYKEQPAIFLNFVSKGSNPDFKKTNKYWLGVDGMPELMAPESDEFKYGEMKDGKISTAIQTYGKAISFTREIFINDDMGVVTKAIQKQSGGFRRLQEKMFFDMLTKSVPFNAKNKNLVETNKDISAKAYSEMRKLMHRQKDREDKTYIGTFPAFLLASDEHEFEHLQILHSASDPAQNNAGVNNPMQNKMVLFTSPWLEGDAYYAIAKPSEMEGIEFTTLNGVDRPYSRTVQSEKHLGIDYQYWMDFGFNLIDYRAFVKNEGV